MIYEPTLTLDTLTQWKRRLARETRQGNWLFTVDTLTHRPLFEAVFARTHPWELAIDPELAGGFAAEFIPNE